MNILKSKKQDKNTIIIDLKSGAYWVPGDWLCSIRPVQAEQTPCVCYLNRPTHCMENMSWISLISS